MAKTILITGGAGFIGSHLAKKLIGSGWQVVIVDRLGEQASQLKKDRLEKFLNPADYKFYNLKLSEAEKLKAVFKENQIDIICHLAAKTNLEPDSELYNRTNIMGTMAVFEMAKEFKTAKVVFASSSMVYGASAKQPFSEADSTDRPLSLYAATKKADEVLAYTYHYLYGIKMVGLRFFTAYGPWSRLNMSINRFTENIINSQPITVHNAGKIKRDYVYVDDLVNGIVAALTKDLAYEIINLGSGQAVELNQVIGLIEARLGRQAEKKFVPMQPGDLAATWADITKAEKLLSFKPQISLEQGINKFIGWYKKYHKL